MNNFIMYVLSRINHRIVQFYNYYIVKEQYPMLTSFSRNSLKKDGAIGLVYMLHHVCEKESLRIPTNEDLKVSPFFLERIIQKYKNLDFDFISLDQLNDIILSKILPTKPFLVFTIDDGYLDNYINALPVFEKYEVPFCIFVATDFIEKKAILWWDCIEDLIMTNDSIVVGDGSVYPCKTFQQRWDTFRYLRERILKLDQSHLEEDLNRMFANYSIDWYKPIKQKGMTWEQVRQLANHPLCTIGGHTVTHPALNKLSFDEAKREIQEGIMKIEKEIGQSVNYFAYPYGTPNEIGAREVSIIEELGIKMAFMAHQGCLTIRNMNNSSKLPRVYFKE